VSRVGQVWTYRVLGRQVDAYLIVADNDDGTYKMVDLRTGDFFPSFQLPETQHQTYWQRLT
jgi:hypothetical protein